jgi:hypothetical protein
LRATSAPAGAADQFRILYDPGASLAQLGVGALPARALQGGDLTGTLGFLSLFQATLLSSGELVADGVPLALVFGSSEVRLRVTLTTGLAVADDVVAEGAPLDADGRFTLVGAFARGTLPPPLDGTAATVSLSCRTSPRPDLSQFALAAVTRASGGKLGRDGGRLRASIELPSGVAPEFTSRPAMLRVSAGTTTVAAVHLPAGLEARGGRSFVGENGIATIAVRAGRGTPASSYVLKVRLRAADLPADAGALGIQLTQDLGGILARVQLRAR